MSKQPKARAALDREATLAHFVALLDDWKPDFEEVFTHLRGTLRWSREEAEQSVRAACARGWIVSDSPSHEALEGGPDFDGNAWPKEQAAAVRAAARIRRSAPIDRIQARRDAILAALHRQTPRSTADLLQDLKSTHEYRRKLERDLGDLQDAGMIQRVEDGWIDVRPNDNTVQHATHMALRLLLDLTGDIMPGDLRESLRALMDAARQRIEGMPSNDPTVRWISALRILTPRHPLNDPQIDPAIRSVIQEAIMTHRKVELCWINEFDGERKEGVFSISHYLVEIPGSPHVVLWNSKGPRYRLSLAEITSARILPTPASFTSDYEPPSHPPQMRIFRWDAEEHGGLTRVIMQVSHKTYAALMQRRIGSLLHVMEEHEDGWKTVWFRCDLDVPTLDFLHSFKGLVLLSPKFVRAGATAPLAAAWNRYKDTAELAKRYGQEEDAYYEELEKVRISSDPGSQT